MLDPRVEAGRIPLEAGHDIYVAIGASAVVVGVIIIIKLREKRLKEEN
ncbi:hypothetical protein KKA03_01825 [archaeon]|nr:hypothetical protein [archaeon]